MLATLQQPSPPSPPFLSQKSPPSHHLFPINHTHQQTERLYLQRGSTSQHLDEVFLKETQRNPLRSHLQSPIMLTDEGSSCRSRHESWNFDPEEEQQKNQIEHIEFFLQKEGLMEAFNSFETFRNLLVESMSQAQQSKTTRTKVSLFQAIADLKAKLLKIPTFSRPFQQYDQKQNEGSSLGKEMKTLLLQISNLRIQNDNLRTKLSALKARLKTYENTDISFDNSLLNNSISYLNSSLCSSENIDEVQSLMVSPKVFSHGDQTDNLKETSKSTTFSLGNSVKEREICQNILQYQCYQTYSIECSRISMKKDTDQTNSVVRAAGDLLNSNFIRDEEYALMIKFVKTLKKTMGHYFQACNLALLRSPRLKEVESILSSYKTFNPDCPSKSSHSQTSNFISFIQSHSNKLATLIKVQLSAALKRKAK